MLMKTIVPREEEKLPTLKVVREEKTPIVEFPREKETKEKTDHPSHRYLLPEQPKGYIKWRGNDLLL
jgi:hypothetical protein